MTVLVSLDCATGFLARHVDHHRGRKPTHVAMLPEHPRDVLWCMENFRLQPAKDQEFGRRLPLVVAV